MTPWTGAVLIGGVSRRMGRDKAAIEIGGRSLAALVADELVAAGADEVLAVGGVEGRAAVAPSTTRWVADDWPGRGPVGGVATALGTARSDVVVVVACDLPALDAATVGRLVTALADAEDADVAVARSTRGREPMIASWRRRARAELVRLLDAGDGAGLHLALDALAAVEVSVDDAVVTNLNRPEDLAAFLSAASSVGTLPAAPTRRSQMDVPEIDVDALAVQLAAGRPLVDVREPDEYAEARVPGARLLPLGSVPDRVGEVPSDGTVYVVCRTGGRSAQAVAFLREQGIDAVNVSGGTLAWLESGREADRG